MGFDMGVWIAILGIGKARVNACVGICVCDVEMYTLRLGLGFRSDHPLLSLRASGALPQPTATPYLRHL